MINLLKNVAGKTDDFLHFKSLFSKVHHLLLSKQDGWCLSLDWSDKTGLV